jgi:hypothetical protein
MSGLGLWVSEIAYAFCVVDVIPQVPSAVQRGLVLLVYIIIYIYIYIITYIYINL